MHDRPRVAEEALDAVAIALREEKIAKYRQLADRCHAINRTFTPETANEEDLAVISRLLQVSTDAYTFYNLRKKILLALLQRAVDKTATESTEAALEERRRLLLSELNFITEQLKRDFKSYCMWHHRRWVYAQLECDPATHRKLLEKDLTVCESLLAQDARNFHCWGFRRWVMEELSKPSAGISTPSITTDERERKYINRLIGDVFSNYSAWHFRVSLLSRRTDWLHGNEEVDYLLQAFYCDPKDSSAFLYAQWLLSHLEGDEQTAAARKVDDACQELLDVEGALKWPLWMQLQIVLGGWVHSSVDVPQRAAKLLEALTAIDPRHIGYYNDMREKMKTVCP